MVVVAEESGVARQRQLRPAAETGRQHGEVPEGGRSEVTRRKRKIGEARATHGGDEPGRLTPSPCP